jgi:ankyrin repeat protein
MKESPPVIFKQPKRTSRPGVDSYGRTPLHEAAARGDAPLVKDLLAAGANPNAQDDNGWTPLHFASQAVSEPVAALLLAAGSDVHMTDSVGNTPLFRAVFCSRGNGSVILALLAAGANPNAANTSGISPLQLANTISNYDLKQYFRKAAFTPEASGVTSSDDRAPNTDS